MFKAFILAYGYLLPSLTLASSIIVSADRIPSEKATTSNQVITYDDLEISLDRGELLWEKIEHSPGVTVSNSGGQGQTSTIFIRGAESRHTLVLFEDIELNDASTTGNLADLSQLSLIHTDSIEILPGSQSVLYGSDAIGGVLRTGIIDLENVRRPHAAYSASFGSHASHSLSLTHYNKIKNTSYFLSAGQLGSNGISQTSVGHNDNSEKDEHYQLSVTGKVLHKLSDKHQVSFLTQMTSSTTDLDKGFGTVRDDENYDTDSRNLIMKFESKSLLFAGFWEPIFRVSSIQNKREDEDGIDSLSATISTFKSRFSRKKISNQNNFYLTQKDTLIAGAEYEKESGQTESLSSGSLSGLSQTSEENQSLYFLHKRTDTIFWSTGFRVQNFEGDTELTYKVAPGMIFSGGRGWFSYSTGFKNPSLFQRNSSSYGNKNLNPEESKSYELGLEIDSISNISINMVLYHLDINNLIDTTGTYPNISYINLNEAKVSGITAGVDHRFAGFSFTRQNSRDSNGFELINRPKLSFKIYGKYYYEDFIFSLNSHYKGKKDSGSAFSRTRLGGYTLHNARVAYSFRNALLLNLNLNNITDKGYTDISGFNTEGFNFKLGFSMKY